MTHVHFIGIGGSGLSAIAQVLLESGYQVSGSDRQLSPLARRLEAGGARVYAGHRAENVQGADLVVRSSAVPDTNVEVQAARQAGIAVLKRADFLGQIMTGRQGIAVAGTHGKTTTTAMLAWVLSALGQDPSYIIGGVSANLQGNAHAGQGQAFVIEADEYDRMFLGLRPQVAVITNIEHDHPDCYPTPEDFFAAFQTFVNLLPHRGWLLACADDAGARRLLAQGLDCQVRTYGIEASDAEFRASHLTLNVHGSFDFEMVRRSAESAGLRVSLQVPGRHNVLNALAVLAVVDCLELPGEAAALALGQFTGTGRRFELCGEAVGVTVISDYAHHPTEIRATLAAARARFAGRRIWAVWQPHTYSRTRTLLENFAAAFNDADRVLVTEIFPAREAPPPDGFSSARVIAAMSHPAVSLVSSLEQAVETLLAQLQGGDVLLVLSAGDADEIGRQVLAGLVQAGPPAPAGLPA